MSGISKQKIIFYYKVLRHKIRKIDRVDLAIRVGIILIAGLLVGFLVARVSSTNVLKYSYSFLPEKDKEAIRERLKNLSEEEKRHIKKAIGYDQQ
ncbi:MAG: hypothetical protein HQ594_03255 [Candidatus Omnitrophica bacterium]|nr:hypothetical protein [Candidatus Omnitrophota bacterium]